MIGYKKCTIVVSVGLGDLVMHNPVIVSKPGEYETEEGCLSLIGVRKTKRYKEKIEECININADPEKVKEVHVRVN